jgi:hypothetical protein
MSCSLVQDLACTLFDVSQHPVFSSQVTQKAPDEALAYASSSLFRLKVPCMLSSRLHSTCIKEHVKAKETRACRLSPQYPAFCVTP